MISSPSTPIQLSFAIPDKSIGLSRRQRFFLENYLQKLIPELIIHQRLKIHQGTIQMIVSIRGRPLSWSHLLHPWLGYVLLFQKNQEGQIDINSVQINHRDLPLPFSNASQGYSLATPHMSSIH